MRPRTDSPIEEDRLRPRTGHASVLHRSIVALLLSATLVQPAHAACPSYNACLTQMQRANDERDFAAAQAATEAAYGFQPDPNLLANLGRFHQKQGHTAQAIDYFERYLRSNAESLTPDVRKNIEARLALLRAPAPPPQATPTPQTDMRSAAPSDTRALGWRFYSGLTLDVAGLTLLGLGSGAMAVNGSCTTDALPCPRVYDSLLQGGAMLGVGVVATGVGVTLVSLDLARRRKPLQLSQQ